MHIQSRSRAEDVGKLLLRLAVGGLMLFHGVFKLQHGVGFVIGVLGEHGLPGFLAYGLYLAEVVAAILILAGFWTRLAALVVAFDMVMAILLVQRSRIFTVSEMSGAWAIEVEMFFLLGALALFFLGGGRYGVSKGERRWD